LVAQVEIDEGKFDDVHGRRKEQVGMKMEKVDVEEEDLHPVGDDIDLGAEDRLLLEQPGVHSVSYIPQPMDT